MPASLRKPQLEWEVDHQVQSDSASIAKYGGPSATPRKMGGDAGLSLELTRDRDTADDIVAQHLEVLGPGPMVASVRDSICGTNIDLGQNCKLDHHEGIDVAGWTDRLLRCEGHALYLSGPEEFSVEIEALDVENL